MKFEGRLTVGIKRSPGHQLCRWYQKISFEQAIAANATGMTIAQRGMLGYDFRLHKDELVEKCNLNYTGHVNDLAKLYDVEQLKELGGIVDYIIVVKPGPGAFKAL